jgi:hypothetical protein
LPKSSHEMYMECSLKRELKSLMVTVLWVLIQGHGASTGLHSLTGFHFQLLGCMWKTLLSPDTRHPECPGQMPLLARWQNNDQAGGAWEPAGRWTMGIEENRV